MLARHTKPFHHIFYCDEEFLLLLLRVCVVISEVTQAIVCLHNQNTTYSKYHFILYWTRYRDGRPAEYRWRPLFNAAKFGWRLLLKFRAVTLPRCETGLNLQGCSKLTKWSQPLVGRSSPYWEDMWRRYCCLTCFFPIVDTCLSCEDIARQSCGMVTRWRFFASFLHALFPASRV